MGSRNRKRKRNQQFDNVLKLLDGYFNHKFRYSSNKLKFHECLSSDQELLSDDVDELQTIKSDLNSTKNLLSSFDIMRWRNHTQLMHKGGEIVRHIKKRIKPELCTKAWCKFYEILSHFNLHLFFGDNFNSFHFCEAPGAFIASLNYFLHIKGYQGKWNWGASTLNPLYEGNDFGYMIDEDSFIKETINNWCFGADDTGDLMVLENIDHIQKLCKKNFKGGIHLVTCDGSFDCANEPEDQERRVFPLHFCEVVASLSVLSKGGTMVLKMFTMFENPSVNLMYLLSGIFEELYAFKPVTSKPGNSEVYVVAMKFKGIPEHILNKLKDQIKNGKFQEDLELFPKSSLPEIFLSEQVECCRMFSTWQQETIMENVQTFLNPDITFDDVYTWRDYFCSHFLSLNHMRKLRRELQVVTNQSTQQHVPEEGRDKEEVIGRGHTGSLLERKKVLTQPVLERLSGVEMFIMNKYEDDLTFQHSYPLQLSEKWNVIYGKLFHLIGSSKFCHRYLLKRYSECLSSELVQLARENTKTIESDIFESLLSRIINQYNIKGVCSTNEAIINNLKPINSSSGIEIIDQSASAENNLRIECFLPCGEPDEKYSIVDQNSISEFIQIILSMNIGCSLLITLGVLLTRISAQIFLILLSHFRQVTIHRSGKLPYFYVFCDHFVGMSRDIRDKLRHVDDSILKISDSNVGRGVLSFLPASSFYTSEVTRALHDINNDYLKMRINHFLESRSWN